MPARFTPAAALRRLYVRATMGTTWLFFAAFALVGFEAVDVVFAFTAGAPEMLPVVIVVLAAIYVVRRRLKRRNAAD
jgi:hypothetical protein